MKKVVVATICCDYKDYSLNEVLARNAELDVPDGVEKLLYVNYESASMSRGVVRGEELISKHGATVDVWAWASVWRGRRQKDQDQAVRLPAIVTARNMAREYAMHVDASAILYIDSDVLVPKDSLTKLWGSAWTIIGGVVPGRGCHSHVKYLGGPGKQKLTENILKVRWGTAGFVMISRDIYTYTAWRHTPTQSEDSLYARDANTQWLVRTDLVAEHLDNPGRPLTEEGTADF